MFCNDLNTIEESYHSHNSLPFNCKNLLAYSFLNTDYELILLVDSNDFIFSKNSANLIALFANICNILYSEKMN